MEDGWSDQQLCSHTRSGITTAFDVERMCGLWTLPGVGSFSPTMLASKVLTYLRESITYLILFLARAWFGLVSSTSPSDPRLDIGSNLAPRLFLFGGGNIGFSTTTSALLDVMDGKVDAFVSRDGITWTQLNYQEGGGTTQISLYSSQEWAKTKIQGSIVYVGLWGMTVHSYDYSNISGVVSYGYIT